MPSATLELAKCIFDRSVNGRTYYGVAKESEEARQEFENRISAGENTGLVQSRLVQHNLVADYILGMNPQLFMYTKTLCGM